MRTLALFAVAACAVASGPAVAQTRATVVSAGNEQAIKVGKTVVSRPFGAVLVDNLQVVGSYGSRALRYHLIRGVAAGECPARFVVTVERPGEAPVTTDPFGTCAATATARLRRGTLEVSMPATVAGAPMARFAYRDGAMRPLADTAATLAAASGAAPSAESGCRAAAHVDAETQAAALADFDESYPLAYRRESSLKKTDIAPEELRELVTGMACLSTWPGAETLVPDHATPLFRSRRYGAAAFSALERIARDPATDANLQAAVRTFSAEMLYRANRPTMPY